jgi:hypothetical protein
MSENGQVEAVQVAVVPNLSNATIAEVVPLEKLTDRINDDTSQDRPQVRTEEEPPAQNHIAALQTQEAEVRRQEEETALIQAGIMIKQKIRACRQQIFSAMQRLQVFTTLLPASNIKFEGSVLI